LLVGFLTAFFSKNMIVILFFALVVSNIIKFGIHIGKEGFSEGVEGEDDDEKKQDGFDESVEGATGMQSSNNYNDMNESGNMNESTNMKASSNMNESGNKKASSNMNESTNMKASTNMKEISGNTNAATQEGMQTLGYRFIAQENSSSSASTMLEQQKKLLSNISTLSPYVINVDNESKLRSQIKYSEYVKH
jgi:hypothetical protein